MNNFYILGFLAVTFLPFLTLLGGLTLWRYLERKKRRRSPFTKGFLRQPGESLRKRLDDELLKFQGYMLVAILFPVLLTGTYFAQNFGTDHKRIQVVLYAAVIAIALAPMLTLSIRLAARVKSLQLGLDGETATGQLLNTLMLNGCHVYHDIACQYGNVDHIVVGPGGVFVIETKARSKPVTGDGKADARVVYDGDSIRFPTHVETRVLDQVRTNASCVSKWLTAATGHKVATRPVVALPGWYVERKGRSDVLVINPEPGESKFMSKPNANRSLTQEEIQRITYQIERENRTIEPESRKYDRTV